PRPKEDCPPSFAVVGGERIFDSFDYGAGQDSPKRRPDDRAAPHVTLSRGRGELYQHGTLALGADDSELRLVLRLRLILRYLAAAGAGGGSGLPLSSTGTESNGPSVTTRKALFGLSVVACTSLAAR